MPRVRFPKLVCVVSALILFLSCSGCATFYWAQTELHEDLSIDRSVVQPQANWPEAQRGKWQHTKPVGPPTGSPFRWPDAIDDIPAAPMENPPKENEQYVAASGHFARLEDLPEHVRFPAPDNQKAATLARIVERHDFGLFVEYIWQETLTDVVELTDMRRARQQLTEESLALVEDILRKAYPGQADFTQLMAWLRDEGAMWAEEVVDAVYENGARSDVAERKEKRLAEQFRAICRRHGLAIPAGDSGEESDSFENVLRPFCEEKLNQLVRAPGGGPIAPEIRSELLEALFPPQRQENAPPSRLETIRDEVIEARYGSREAFEKHLAVYLSRLFGVHYTNVGQRYFHYGMVMPGVVVETNGRIRSDNRVEWEFAGSEAYPVGYRMYCRSMMPDLEAQRALLGRAAITSRDDLLFLRGLTRRHASLPAALRDAASSRSLEPLRQWLDTDGEIAAADRKRLRGLLSL